MMLRTAPVLVVVVLALSVVPGAVAWGQDSEVSQDVPDNAAEQEGDGIPIKPQNADVQTEQQIADIEAAEDRVTEDPLNIELLIELGNLYYDAMMQNEALATYLKAVEIDSTHVGALMNLGSLYTDLGNFDEAQEQLEKARALDPENPMVYTNLGTSYYSKQRYPEAIDMYRKALELDPNNVEAHFNLGVAFADAQIFDEAIVEWQKVIELAGDSPVAQICRDNIQMIEEFRSSN